MAFEKPPVPKPEKPQPAFEKLLEDKAKADKAHAELMEKRIQIVENTIELDILRDKADRMRDPTIPKKIESRTAIIKVAPAGLRIEEFILDVVSKANQYQAPVTGQFHGFEFTVENPRTSKVTVRETYKKVMAQFKKMIDAEFLT